MGRIGFRTIEEIKEAERLLLVAGAEIEGIFTHFATADEADDRKFQAQYHFFKEVLVALLKPFLRLFMLVIQPPLCGMQIRFSQLFVWEMSCMA